AEHLKDLAQMLDDDTVVGIFNEELSREEDGQKRYIDLWRRSEDERCLFARVWRIGRDEWEMQNETGDDHGTIIIKRIAIERARDGLTNDSKIYFRFRVMLPQGEENPFIKTIKPKDRSFLSGFDRLECIDFRLNESRNLPQKISRLLGDSNFSCFNMQQIHFLLAIDVSADYISGHSHFHKCRMLENGLWNKYTGSELSSHMVIYHWKVSHSDGPIRDFNAF
ncbi:MAG: hypothetical protein HQL94_09710, partial [Magnetococcales bacterium]|nr:hypothetical protein [Magnetococcales bacterium]